MSEARRRRQQEREEVGKPNPHTRKFFIWGGIAVLFVAAYSAGWYYNNHRHDAFAKCLASKQVKMYGLYWCPHCIEQKQKFGKSFRYVPYVECAISLHEAKAECKEAGVKNYPTWQFEPGGPLHEGELSLEDLSGRTGCSLP